MSGDRKDDEPPFGEQPTGGRFLVGAMFVAAVVLLAMVGRQTTPGSMGQTVMSGGWWAEPALAPTVALIMTIIASAIAFFVARRESVDVGKTVRVYGQILLISGCMIGAVMLMKVLGFALSILVFASVVATTAGFRGTRLVLIALGTTVAMVLIFRIGFSIWFPRPALFKWLDLPVSWQGIL
ncbi:MAG: hypothetical protein F4213_22410 [Boseongicola sp. SB0677_bin_26]|nr:hypothetical protein [Boseongicola sp. SB0665_bin_10]MYG28733.1 hypothetical protein [Boseongicola sp. SB0677_bin_26]